MEKSKNQLAYAKRMATRQAFKQFAYAVVLTIAGAYTIVIACVFISNAL